MLDQMFIIHFFLLLQTCEKVCDHLSAHWEEDGTKSATEDQMISRNYVQLQLKSLNHALTLLALKSGVDHFHLPL